MIRKYKYMYDILKYIENGLSDNLDTELITCFGYVSYDKLYRDFYNLTGHSVKEYIRKRRLSNALALIKTSELSFSDIAYKCGFSSHQSLCRSIKQTLDLTPSEYKNSDVFYIFPPYNGNPIQSVIITNDTIPRVMRVIFYHSSLMEIENTTVNTFLNVFPNYNGRIFGRNGKQEGDKFCYELYLSDMEIDYSLLKPYGFEIMHEIKCFNSLFVLSTVQNDERKINAAWNYLYSHWLQNSMFEYTDEPYYEEYIIKNGKPVKLKLFLPIKKRSDETKINLIVNPKLRFIVANAEGFFAEKKASKTVIDYLLAHYPYIIETINDLYVHKENNYYVCGIPIHSDLHLIDDKNIGTISTTYNNYLVLESNVMGDYDRYSDILLSFARDNGLYADKNGIFALYDARNSFDKLKIRMYCPIKIRKK